MTFYFVNLIKIFCVADIQNVYLDCRRQAGLWIRFRRILQRWGYVVYDLRPSCIIPCLPQHTANATEMRVRASSAVMICCQRDAWSTCSQHLVRAADHARQLLDAALLALQSALQRRRRLCVRRRPCAVLRSR